MELRDYQKDALAALRREVDKGVRRCVIALPTGGGKTIVFASAPDALDLSLDDKVLILVHRDELAEQAVEKWHLVNPMEMVGVEKASRRAGPFNRVVVASVQTLKPARLGEFLNRWGMPRLIITDEAHHAIAPGYTAIYDACGVRADGDVVHLGVTATPKRSDNVGLDAVFDRVAYSIGISDLIKRGHLVPLKGYRVQTNQTLDNVRTLAGDFNAGQLADAVDTPQRNAKVVQSYRDICPGEKAVVFCASVQHSMNLRDLFDNAGISAAHVDGTTPLEERRQTLRDFHDGKVRVVTNCAVLTEGYDEPTIDAVIIARPTKSSVLYTQMIGRGTRLSPGKTACKIIDMVDATRKHTVVTIPTLLGLPPAFNLGGRDATDVAERFNALAANDPMAALLMQDADQLEAMEKLPADQRLRALVKMMLDRAKQDNNYISVDLFQPPQIADEFAGMMEMTWVPMPDESFRLRLRQDTLTVKPNTLGRYYARIERRDAAKPEVYGPFPGGAREAFAFCESWVRKERGDQVHFHETNRKWRNEIATDKQKAMLRKFRVQFDDASLTKGEAGRILDTIFEALAAGKEPK